MISAISRARRQLRPARLGFGRGTADVNVNRDVPGEDRYELGLNPGGVSDKTVSVVRVNGEDGATIAVWFNYAVHSTVTLWTGFLSADLAGAAERYVEDALGTVALFAPGTLADQAPRVSYENAAPEQRGERGFAFRAAEEQGAILGAEVVRVAAAITGLRRDLPLRAVERVAPYPVKRGVDVMTSMKQHDAPTVDLRPSLVRIGDIALAGVNGEVGTRSGGPCKRPPRWRTRWSCP